MDAKRDGCALQEEGGVCACGRLRPGCEHFIRARPRRLSVTLAEGLAAARALQIAVAIRGLEGVASVRLG
jgi:hypothetical protein